MTVSIDINEEGEPAELETSPPAMVSTGAGSEEERTLLGIRQARDLVLAKNRELIDKLALAEDRIAELTYERDDLATAREVAQKTFSDQAHEIATLRDQLSRLSEERTAHLEVEQVYILARTEIEADLVSALETIRGHVLEIDLLRGQLEAAQAARETPEPSSIQLEDTLRQLAELRDDHARIATQHEEALARLAGQLAKAEQARDDSWREVERLVEERDALQKQAAADKAALEARLAALPPPAPAPKAAPVARPAKPGAMAGPPPPIVRAPVRAPAAKTPPPVPATPPLSDKDLRSLIENLHRLLKAVESAPELPEPLTQFDSHLRDLADRARSGGFDLIHHLSSAASEFTDRLRATPARVGAALPALAHTVEMLGWLGLRGREQMIDATGALVYAVDDDVDNCECIAMAFEKIALQTKYSVRPEVALEQIAASACELIVLDVDLPGMDGFALHALIRRMPGRERIPIIFLSGHLSTIERLAALADDHTEFVAKPYSLSELSLRALSRIVEARLG